MEKYFYLNKSESNTTTVRGLGMKGNSNPVINFRHQKGKLTAKSEIADLNN